jgi:hypothetical protein
MNSVVRLLLMFFLVVSLNPAFSQSKRERKAKSRADFGVNEGKLDRAEDVAFSEPFATKVKNDRRELLKPNKGRAAKRPDALHGKSKHKKKKAKKQKDASEGEK